MEKNSFTDAMLIAELLRRYTQGELLSEEETELLTAWRAQNQQNEQLFTKLQTAEELAVSLYELKHSDTEASLQRFKQKINTSKRTRQLYKVAAVAAAALVIVSAGIYRWSGIENKASGDHPIVNNAKQKDVLPATNKATLTLASGKIIELREDMRTVIADSSGISYENGKSITDTKDIPYATIATPRGGQYQVTLSDGSKVSLNAGSSLEYPLQFKDNDRRVKLRGEGYFEISHHSSKPFIVTTESQEVKVLGTVFNVQAYAAKEITTLVSGRVSVSDNMTKKQITLQPNTQAIVNKGIITTKKVDADDYTGWKKGRFQADLITLRDLAQDIERWYDVQFIYPAHYNNTEKAFISINRNEKLSKVLKTLELTYNVHFRIQGKEVYIR